jgi:cytoskeleton protein RodZ
MEETAAPASAPKPRSIGERLRAGRERAGLSVAAAAEKLHLDPKVIESLEADRFAELGPSVYVRGHLRRYADFVGEPGIELVNAYTSRQVIPPAPDLTQIPQAERRTDPRRMLTPMVGVGCAIILASAIWWVLAGSGAGGDASSDAAAPSAGSPTSTAAPAPPSNVTPAPSAEPPAVQLVSKTASSSPPDKLNGSAVTDPAANAAAEAARREEVASARQTTLRLELTSESWVEVYDSRGQRLFYDVASAGSVQSIEGRPPLRVVLGNAAAVAVQVDGRARNIPAGAMEGEGARFVVNRSGSLSRSR